MGEAADWSADAWIRDSHTHTHTAF